MSTHRDISRRTILRGMGAAVALPILDVMLPTAASASKLAAASGSAPRRMAYFYFPNGIAGDIWRPEQSTASGQLTKLNEWMSPLEPFKSDIVIPNNIHTPLGNGHGPGTATWLTGADYEERDVSRNPISADQVAARHVQNETLLPSLEISMKGEGFFSNSLPRNALSWSERGPMTREVEPRVIFERMFGSPSGGATNRTVMDFVLNEAKSLRRIVSGADQQRLDEYFESIQALERRIRFAEKQSEEAEADGGKTDSRLAPEPGIPLKHEEYIRLMLDLMVVAFQSDATRVVTFMLDHGQSNRYCDFIDGVRGTWHALSHYQDASGKTEDDDGVTAWNSVEEKRRQFAEVTKWHHAQMAYLFGRLKSIEEPDGRSLLDNSMICYGSNLSDGHEHGDEDLPILIAGKGGGTIRSGRLLKFDKPTDLAELHTAFLQRMGVGVEGFGTAKRAMSELAS